jgi:hypothetical protein
MSKSDGNDSSQNLTEVERGRMSTDFYGFDRFLAHHMTIEEIQIDMLVF